MKILLIAILSLYSFVCLKAQAIDTYSDTWVGVDALGRKVLTSEDGLEEPTDRLVGMFYYLCLSSDGRPNMPFHDVTTLLNENVANPAWGVEYESHFWGKPVLGYYDNMEKYAYQKHMQWLVDAGIDFLFFDTTNGWLYIPSVKILMEVLDEREALGMKNPKLAFMLNQTNQQQHVQTLYDELYSKPQYDKYWFNYLDKPLILVEESQAPNEEIRNHFTFRKSWAWMEGKKQKEWPWLENYPQHPGYNGDKSNIEQISVSTAQHAHTRVGKSFHNGKQPAFDKYGLCDSTAYGLYFQEQFDHAQNVKAPILMITQFNEWVAMRMIAKNQGEANACRPGGTPQLGESWFIDAYNAEFNRDIEPSMHPLILDNYYLQMISNVRRYKGVRKLPVSNQSKQIKINGELDQWDDISLEYLDDIADIQHRSTRGFQYVYPMTNNTGRNDIVRSKVVHTNDSVFFYVETASKLSNFAISKNWIMLLVNTDKDYTTGWEGYDFCFKKINGKYALARNNKNQYDWEFLKNVNFLVSDNKLHFSVARKDLGLDNNCSFDFKWVDNLGEKSESPDQIDNALPSVMDLYTIGDAAPNGRLNYRYTAANESNNKKVRVKKKLK